MPISNSKSINRRPYHRFLRLFHHKKPSYPAITHSYQYLLHFPRLPITLPPFIPTFLSSRWNNNDDDDDDCEVVSRKPLHNYHHYQHIRRRIPKRYSDIVGPSSAKFFLSNNREKHHHYLYNRSSANILRRHSLKPLNETIYYFNSSKKKSREIKDHRYHQTNDHLAHRMQAVMSSELMNSLDRNFVLGDRRQLIPRSHSLNIFMRKNKKTERKTSFHFIPRVKMNFKKNDTTFEEPTPDYDEQDDELIIRTIENENDTITEEPIADYDDSKPTSNSQSDEKTITPSDQALSSSFVVPQTSANDTDEQESIPPIPPPLPELYTELKQTPFRCRTIADELSSDHKLILKDEEKSEQPQPHYIHVSKELTLRKISQTLTRSHSVFSSISQFNDRTIELKPSITDQQTHDVLSSSPTASVANENDYEHRSSSSKIYQEYKKRTSSSTISRNHSMLIHPMHTRIGLRSSTSSSSTNEKFLDMTLSSKQMNVCVINQLNEHLSTRFSQQHKQDLSTNNKTEHQSYDKPPSPPPPELMSENNHIQSNVYDEPNDLQVNNQIVSPSIPPPPPPPPPPLPVGGFRPILPSINRPSNSQRTSIMTLTRAGNNSDLPFSSNRTSTISSNLSDSRILRELRENPLFARAKQVLEIESGFNGRRSGRRLNGSTTNLTQNDNTNNESVSYLRLDDCSKSSLKKSSESTIPKQLETIIMLPSELDALMGKRTKSTNDINQVKSRPSMKLSSQTQYRQSELERIFQKRAQRSEQNLT